jgi:prepilin-type N-terminal cleavage/methylation domain-containing protein/prepilin-type processing-associated H-X9-DG protein
MIRRRAFTVIELLVTIAIVGLLVSLIMPAIQQSRETARRSQCQHHLRQLGLAMHEHGSTFDRLPALGYMGLDSNGIVTPFFGWTLRILPHIEMGNLYRQWDFDKPLDDPANLTTASQPVPLFRCPSDPTVVGKRDLSYVVNGGFGWTIYLSGAIDCPIGYPSLNPIDINGNGIRCPPGLNGDGAVSDRDLLIRTGVFFLESWKVPGIERHHTLDTFYDGKSHTILLTENIRSGYDPLNPKASWATADPMSMGFFLPTDICNGGSCSPANFTQSVANGTNGINSGLNQAEGKAPWPSSLHVGGVNICLADGSVRFLSENISSNVYYALVTSQGSEFQGPMADQPSAMSNF